MVHHKLDFTDFFSSEFALIAIHSKIEDYRLAFFLNKIVGLGLIKSDESVIQLVKGVSFDFSKYLFEDEENMMDWILVENKQLKQSTGVYGNLFMNFEQVSYSYLIPELKKADYILKVEGDFEVDMVADVIEKTKQINNIQMAYAVDVNQIKSKNNLIF